MGLCKLEQMCYNCIKRSNNRIKNGQDRIKIETNLTQDRTKARQKCERKWI